MPTVEFHAAVTLNETFSHMMYFLVRSIERFSELGSNYKIIFTVSLDSTIGLNSYLLSWARQYPVEFRFCDERLWEQHKARADRLKRWGYQYTATGKYQLAYDFAGDVVIYIDADTVVCGPLSQLVEKAAGLNKIFGWLAWQPQSIDLNTAMRERGCVITDFGLTYSGYGWSFMEPKSCPPYFNYGFVAMSNAVAKFVAKHLPDDLKFVSERFYDFFNWQVALCLLITRT